MNLSIPDMSCGHCRETVTRTLTGLDPQARVEVDLPARRARVETSASAEAVVAALAGAGFEAAVG